MNNGGCTAAKKKVKTYHLCEGFLHPTLKHLTGSCLFERSAMKNSKLKEKTQLRRLLSKLIGITMTNLSFYYFLQQGLPPTSDQLQKNKEKYNSNSFMYCKYILTEKGVLDNSCSL